MNRRTQPAARSGFTLIELLVVIVIIGLLASMLLPAVAHVKEKGQRVTCMNNAKQIGLCLRSYAGDYRDKFPTNLVALSAYCDNDAEIFICPSTGHDPEPDGAEKLGDETCDFNYIRDLTGSSNSTMMVLCEKNGESGNIAEGDDGWGGNHAGKGGNLLRLDGAVKWVPGNSLAMEDHRHPVFPAADRIVGW